MSKWVCRVLGVVFVVAGLATFVFGEETDFSHNVLHFVTGLVALYVGFRAVEKARLFCLAFGAAYLAFGVLGLLLGDPNSDRLWHIGPLHLMTGDHMFHIVLGAVVLLGVIRSRRADRLVQDAQAQ